LQYTLSLIFTEGKKFSVSLPEVSKLLSEKPAKLAGLGARKGQIAPDFDADLIVFDQDEKWTITADTTST
jgi:allantoinase